MSFPGVLPKLPQMQVVSRFDARNWPTSRHTWLGKLLTAGQVDQLIPKTLPSSISWASAAAGNGRIVAVGGSGVSAYSLDNGATWTAGGTMTVSNTMIHVFFAAGLFVALSFASSGNNVFTSPDGNTWTARAAVAASPVCGTYDGTAYYVLFSTGDIYRSTDGITWSSVYTGSAAAKFLGYVKKFSLFVKADVNGISTSPDAVTWTLRSSINNTIYGGDYGNGVFVFSTVTGSLPNTPQLLYSTDLINWYSKDVANGADSGRGSALQSLIFNNGAFYRLTGGGLSASADGLNWRAATSCPAQGGLVALPNGQVGAIGTLGNASSTQGFWLPDPNAQDLIYVA